MKGFDDDGYFRNESCALNLMPTFLLLSSTASFITRRLCSKIVVVCIPHTSRGTVAFIVFFVIIDLYGHKKDQKSYGLAANRAPVNK